MYVYILRLPTFHEYCMHIICIFVIYRDYSWFFYPKIFRTLPSSLTRFWLVFWLRHHGSQFKNSKILKIIFLPIVGLFPCG